MIRRKRNNQIRSNDPAGTRRRVLDAAAFAFQQRGFGATSVHDLIRAAKVTGGALHHHFPSKKSIALAVIAERVSAEISSTWVDRIHAAADAKSGIIEVFGDVIEQLEGAERISGCPLNNLALELSLADSDFRNAVVNEFRSWRAAIAAKVAQDLARGEADYAADGPDEFATFAVALFSGAIGMAKAEQSTASLRHCRSMLERLMS
jgi:AcrR family transcriptional regulator